MRALARLARNIRARNKAANGPVPGKIPENTPKPIPKAILGGVSFILTNFRQINFKNFRILFISGLLFIFQYALKNLTDGIFRQRGPEFDIFGYLVTSQPFS